jgi:outer membrane immunogenic protein
MKKFALALATTAAFTGSAFAADMAIKAPPPIAPAPVFSWTGCYIGGGAGYGMWNQDVTAVEGIGAASFIFPSQTVGGRGWFGTVGGGCDYQFSLGIGIPGINQMVIGALADYDFGSLKGTVNLPGFDGNTTGSEKMSSAWYVGGRIGWLVTPQVLTYFSGGYTQARFDQVNQNVFQDAAFGDFANPGTAILAHTYSGWFLGSGLEYTTNWLPGLFWKTEYRFSEYRADQLAQVCVISSSCGTLGPTGMVYDSQKFVQTIRTELVYRFNWGGPVVAKY